MTDPSTDSTQPHAVINRSRYIATVSIRTAGFLMALMGTVGLSSTFCITPISAEVFGDLEGAIKFIQFGSGGLIIPGLLLMALSTRLASFLVPTPTESCPGCGYDLREINSERCPECGTRLRRDQPAEDRQQS